MENSVEYAQVPYTGSFEHHQDIANMYSNTGMVGHNMHMDGQSEDVPNNTAVQAGTHTQQGNSVNNNDDNKKRRTKSGCLTCRRRKIKCGEEKPTCHRCEIARLDCEGYLPIVESKATKAKRSKKAKMMMMTAATTTTTTSAMPDGNVIASSGPSPASASASVAGSSSLSRSSSSSISISASASSSSLSSSINSASRSAITTNINNNSISRSPMTAGFPGGNKHCRGDYYTNGQGYIMMRPPVRKAPRIDENQVTPLNHSQQVDLLPTTMRRSSGPPGDYRHTRNSTSGSGDYTSDLGSLARSHSLAHLQSQSQSYSALPSSQEAAASFEMSRSTSSVMSGGGSTSTASASASASASAPILSRSASFSTAASGGAAAAAAGGYINVSPDHHHLHHHQQHHTALMPPLSSSSASSATHTPSISQSSHGSSSIYEEYNRHQQPISHRSNNGSSNDDFRFENVNILPPPQAGHAFSQTLAPAFQQQQQPHHHPHQQQHPLAHSPPSSMTVPRHAAQQIYPSPLPSMIANNFAPFAYDSPFPMQPFASFSATTAASSTLGGGISNGNQHCAHAQNNAPLNGANMIQANNPIAFDSLFGYTNQNMQEHAHANAGAGETRAPAAAVTTASGYSGHGHGNGGDAGDFAKANNGNGNGAGGEHEYGDSNGNGTVNGLVGAPFPVDYWEDQDFVDRIMSGFQQSVKTQGADSPTVNAMQQAVSVGHPSPYTNGTNSPMSYTTVMSSGLSQAAGTGAQNTAATSNAPSISSDKSSSAITPPASNPAILTRTGSMDAGHVSDSQSQTHSPRSVKSAPSASAKGKIRTTPLKRPSSVSPSSPATAALTKSPAVRVPSNLTSAASINSPPRTSTTQPTRQINTTIADFGPQPAIDPILQATSMSELHKAAANRNKNIPSLKELELGPPPNLHGNQKEWSIPPVMNEALKGMTNARHVELLKHYFINLVGLFSPIDHPRNPFRTFVAEHATQSLSLLHAVLAVSAINQQPLSVEARAESLLYFEAAVDLYVRSLQQQDDISLFTLLFLSLYYAFDSGTAQPQHFSRRAQSIINDRFELLGPDFVHAYSDFRFLVRLHVWYETMANVSRTPGDLRDMDCGRYTLSYLISIIELWDAQEEQAAGISGINEDYVMTGCVGVPTFFISLLNDISLLKEEQHNILSMSVDPTSDANNAAAIAATRKNLISKHTRKIRDLECKIQFARPGRLLLPPIVANESQLHRAVSVRFFDLFRLAASIHLLVELQGTPVNDPAIQLRTSEMVNLLGNIEQNSNYNTSGIWAFFIAGAAATNHMDRIALHRRLDSTWNSPCGNVWSLRSVLDEVWQRNAEAQENNESCQNWKEIAQQRGWTLLLM